jgi:hypothetical protein
LRIAARLVGHFLVTLPIALPERRSALRGQLSRLWHALGDGVQEAIAYQLKGFLGQATANHVDDGRPVTPEHRRM